MFPHISLPIEVRLVKGGGGAEHDILHIDEYESHGPREEAPVTATEPIDHESEQ